MIWNTSTHSTQCRREAPGDLNDVDGTNPRVTTWRPSAVAFSTTCSDANNHSATASTPGIVVVAVLLPRELETGDSCPAS
jgi:hypothetical protein